MRRYLVAAMMAMAGLASTSPANAQTATQDINITANVASYCTIANITNPAALAATIPVTNGVVDPTVINRTVANVACNSATDVIATSLTGGVTPGGAPNAGTTNIIDYAAIATFGGATSNLDTATVGGAAGSEAGSTGTTAGAATGNLVVDITPAQPALPLMPSAAYADTLRVTLTAQ